MLNLPSIGSEIARRRRVLRLRQIDLARKAGVSRATVDALENGRLGELGFIKITKILAVVGLDLKLGAATTRRPTLEELRQEVEHDDDLSRWS